MTMLHRIGSKRYLARKIASLFPPHVTYVEPFFGSGSVFFYKTKARYNILNDYDGQVYNLYRVMQDSPAELYEELHVTPAHENLLNEWKHTREENAVRRAAAFLMSSNLSLYSAGGTFNFHCTNNPRTMLLQRFPNTAALIRGARFMNCDFRGVLRRLGDPRPSQILIYADPPYIGVQQKYSSKFSHADSTDLFDMLEAGGTQWAMSELDSPFILEQVEKRKLNIFNLGEYRHIKMHRRELLITNYKIKRRL